MIVAPKNLRVNRCTMEFDKDTIELGGHAVTCIEGLLKI